MRILNSKPLLLMCLLLFFVVGIGTKTLADKMTDDAELPIKKILIEVKKSQRDVFFDEIKSFAEKHGFAVRIAPTTPSGDDFIVEMRREDFKILGVNTFDPERFQIGLYKDGAQKIPSVYINSLLNDFDRAMVSVGLNPEEL